MPREPLLKKSPQKIGEILVKHGWISNEALGRALDQQARPAVKKVGEILKASGQVTEEQLAQALAEQYGLQYFDLQGLPEGWKIDRDLYTFKWKHLHILPMRDVANVAWLMITEATADEKLILQIDNSVDLSRLRFGVVAATVLDQILSENPASNETVFPPVPQQLTIPPAGEVSGDPALEAVPGLAKLTLDRLLAIVGALWSESGVELERNAVIAIKRGPRFRIEVRQAVMDQTHELPPGYVHLVSSRVGRRLDVEITLPHTSVEGAAAELDWPVVWPPPDLVDSVGPLLDAQCRVPPFLRHSRDSLRWMSTGSGAREALNDHLIAAAGVSLGHARIDDRTELWQAIRARARGLEANQAARLHWDRWKSAQSGPLEIAPGHILAMASLATGSMPRALAPTLEIQHADGPVFAVELYLAGNRPTLSVISGPR